MKTSNEQGTGTVPPAKGGYHRSKAELRKEYRRREWERAEKSASLAIMYPQLKTLTVDLLYFDREIISRGNRVRYRANLETAKSELQFICPSRLCHRGGFNMSENLRSAVAGHRKTLEGEMHCHGSRDQETGKTVPCQSTLHFKMSLTFKTGKTAAKNGKISRAIPAASSPAGERDRSMTLKLSSPSVPS